MRNLFGKTYIYESIERLIFLCLTKKYVITQECKDKINSFISQVENTNKETFKNYQQLGACTMLNVIDEVFKRSFKSLNISS